MKIISQSKISLPGGRSCSKSQLSSLFSPPTSRWTGCHHIHSALINDPSELLDTFNITLGWLHDCPTIPDNQGTSPADESPHLAIADTFSKACTFYCLKELVRLGQRWTVID